MIHNVGVKKIIYNSNETLLVLSISVNGAEDRTWGEDTVHISGLQ